MVDGVFVLKIACLIVTVVTMVSLTMVTTSYHGYPLFRNSFWTLIGWHGADNLRKMINSSPSYRWAPNTFNSGMVERVSDLFIYPLRITMTNVM